MVHKRHSKHKKGGSSNWNSASSYNSYVNGTENAQYDRVFSTSGPYANVQGGVLIGAQGQNSVLQGTPSAQNLSLVQSAGKKGKSRSRRGGLWGQVINQAVVPFGLLAMQQTYRKKKQGGKRTHKKRHGGKKSRKHY